MFVARSRQLVFPEAEVVVIAPGGTMSVVRAMEVGRMRMEGWVEK
jgi:hypothetical protein